MLSLLSSKCGVTIAAAVLAGCGLFAWLKKDRAPQQFYPWAVYYADDAPVEDFAGFKLLVLDSDYHPPLEPLLKNNTILLGYISLGEVEQHRNWFSRLDDPNLVLHENKNWPNSYFVDMRVAEWQQMVLDDIIPSILAKGFSGLFYDTLDNAETLERLDPVAYTGVKKAAIDLLRQIRTRYPDIRIMMNRGYGLLPEAAPYIDMLLAESAVTDYDFEQKKYRWRPAADYDWQRAQLSAAQAKNPALGLYTLDYWEPEDSKTIQKIYDINRQHIYSPYVATIDLKRLFTPPP